MNMALFTSRVWADTMKLRSNYVGGSNPTTYDPANKGNWSRAMKKRTAMWGKRLELGHHEPEGFWDHQNPTGWGSACPRGFGGTMALLHLWLGVVEVQNSTRIGCYYFKLLCACETLYEGSGLCHHRWEIQMMMPEKNNIFSLLGVFSYLKQINRSVVLNLQHS